MNFRNISQLSDQILDWSKRLPRDIDVVVGIPRSGLLAVFSRGFFKILDCQLGFTFVQVTETKPKRVFPIPL